VFKFLAGARRSDVKFCKRQASRCLSLSKKARESLDLYANIAAFRCSTLVTVRRGHCQIYVASLELLASREVTRDNHSTGGC
jgi:hypothetical protein